MLAIHSRRHDEISVPFVLSWSKDEASLLTLGVTTTVINDSEGVANSFTFNASDLTAAWQHLDDLVTGEIVFRTPLVVPDLVYFRIRTSTAVSATTSVFLDQISCSFGPQNPDRSPLAPRSGFGLLHSR